MIAQRFAKALKAQDWMTVAIELSLVVIGVLAALQVSNWNEARKNHRGAVAALERLNDEIKTNFAAIDEHIEKIESIGDERRAAAAALLACDNSDIDYGALINQLVNDIMPPLTGNALAELGRQNAFLLLYSDEFRRAMNVYQGRLDDERGQLAINFDLMWRDHIMFNPAVDMIIAESELVDLSFSVVRPFEEVCRDPTFRRQFAMTAGWHDSFVLRLQRFKAWAEEFEADIENERARLN